jgi:MFS family permease
VNKFPRKMVLLIGLSIQALTSFGFAFNTYFATDRVRGYISIPLIAFNIMAYQCGVASLLFLIMSELFSTNIRAFAVSQMNGLLWTLNTIINTIIPLLFNTIGMYTVYWIFSGIAAIGVISLGIMLPETRKKVLISFVDLEVPLVQDEEMNELVREEKINKLV